MKCKLCQREAEHRSEYCARHLAAEEMLRNAYLVWKRAYSGLSWAAYLDKVKQLKGTGLWVKEIIESERENKID